MQAKLYSYRNSYEYQLSDYNWTSLDLIRRVEVDMSAAPWGAISMMKLTTQASFSDKSDLVESLDGMIKIPDLEFLI